MWPLAKLRERYLTVIDVGTDSIKALAAERSAYDAPPRALKKFVLSLTSRPHSPERVAAKLHELLFVIIKELAHIPYKVVVGIGPDFTDCKFQTWESLRGGSGRGSPKEIRRQFEILQVRYSDPERPSMHFPLELLINGYPVASRPFHADKVVGLEFRTFSATLPSEIHKKFLHLAQSFGGIPMEFVPLAVAQTHAARDALGLQNTFIIDIGGDVTSLLLIQDGTLTHVNSFPHGANAIKEHWQQEFIKTLPSFYQVGPLPPLVLLTGGGAHILQLSQFLRTDQWLQSYSWTATPEIRHLEGQGIFGGNTLGGFINGSEEAGLASLLYHALYYEPLF